MPTGYARIDKATVFINFFRCLCDDILVLNICRQVMHLFGNPSGRFIDLAIRGDKKSVFIYSRVTGKIRDQADVRTFRGFDRAHPAVMTVVNIAYVEIRSFSG